MQNEMCPFLFAIISVNLDRFDQTLHCLFKIMLCSEYNSKTTAL